MRTLTPILFIPETDEYGFLGKSLQLLMKYFQRLRKNDLGGTPLDQETIKLFAVSTLQIVGATAQNKVLRFGEELDQRKKQKEQMKQIKSEKRKLRSQVSRSPPWGANDLKFQIDKIFLDSTGIKTNNFEKNLSLSKMIVVFLNWEVSDHDPKLIL